MSEKKGNIRTICLGNEKLVIAHARHRQGYPARVLERVESAVEGAAREMNHKAVLALAEDLRRFSNGSEGTFKKLFLCRSQFLEGIEKLLGAGPEANAWRLGVVEAIVSNQRRLLEALKNDTTARRKMKAPESLDYNRPITVDDVLTIVAVGTESDAQLLARLSGDAGKRS